MATVAHHRRSRTFWSQKRAEGEQPQPPRPHRRWLRRAALAAIALLALVAALPWLATHTPLADWAVAAATRDLHGSLRLGSLSLGWFSPIAASNVELRDADDQSLATVEQLSTERSLLSLLFDHASLGKVRLERPKLHLVMRDNGSNLEEIIAPYLDQPSSGGGGNPGVQLEIVDGTILVSDATDGASWQLDDLDFSLKLPADAAATIEMKVSTTVADAARPGRLEAELAWPANGAGQFTATLDRFPLLMAQPLVARCLAKPKLGGLLSARLTGQWGAADGAIALGGSATAEDVVFGAAALGDDRVTLHFVELSGQAAGDAHKLVVQPTKLQCDLGGAELSGEIDLGQLAGTDVAAAVLHQSLHTSGQIDLPKLAAMLPGTLHLRDETRITAGALEWDWEGRRAEAGMSWLGRVQARQLRATHQGRDLDWQRPLQVELAAHDTPAGPVVDRLRGASDFVQIDAAGSLAEMTVASQFDLRPLLEKAGQFFDLGGLQLGGQGNAKLALKQNGPRYDLDGGVQLKQVEVASPGMPTWNSDMLSLDLKAAAETKPTTSANAASTADAANRASAAAPAASWANLRILEAALQLRTSHDQLDARLTQAVDEPARGPWPWQAVLAGRFESLAPLLRLGLPAEAAAPSGALRLEAKGAVSPTSIEIQQCQLTARPLRWNTPWINLNESEFLLDATGAYDLQHGALSIPSAKLQAEALAATARDIRFGRNEAGATQWTGALDWQADVGRVWTRFVSAETAKGTQMAGAMQGAAQVGQSGDKLEGTVQVRAMNVVLRTADGGQFAEPSIQLAAEGSYSAADGALDLRKASLTSSALAADVAGNARFAAEGMPVDVKGQWQYDWARLGPWLQPYVGNAVRIRGSGKSPIAYRGPLAPATATGETSLRWDAAKIYGFPLGPADVRFQLANGILTAGPIQTSLSGGQVALAPQLYFAVDPAQLYMPAGKIADNVQITPEMCASGLQYIAPVLAGVAEAQGTFSIDLDGLRMPLRDWRQMDAGGRMTIHSVEIGPGPLIRELALLTGRAVPGRLKRESVVPFRVVQGRVYHQGLELEFPDLTVRTYGWVGFDQTMAIKVEMPVPPKLLDQLKNAPAAAAALRNQTLEIPVAGTLAKPKLDQKTFDQIMRQFTQNAVQNVIDDQLGKHLDRLFGPPPSK